MHNVVVNLLGVGLDNRPGYVSEEVRKLRSSALQYRPAALADSRRGTSSFSQPVAGWRHSPQRASHAFALADRASTPHAQGILQSIDIVIAAGKDPHETICGYCEAAEVKEPRLEPVELDQWELLAWFRHRDEAPFIVQFEPGKTEHKRYIRKYAEGDR
jgi:hypothetical protein